MTVYRWSSARRRREAAKADEKKYVVTNDKGRPVAVAPDETRARMFVYNNAELGINRTTHWTGTGKFMLDGAWTGWEVREVAAL